jgi:expansin (peptidoglycan-binding protein)
MSNIGYPYYRLTTVSVTDPVYDPVYDSVYDLVYDSFTKVVNYNGEKRVLSYKVIRASVVGYTPP